MTPYYETELGKLYHGDCLEIMPELEPVDLVLTDPPYGINIGLSKNHKCGKYGKQGDEQHINSEWDSLRPSKDTIGIILRIGKNQIIFGGNYLADMLPSTRGWVVWDKMNDMFYSTSDGELIWTSYDKALRFFRRSHGMDKGFMVRDGFGNVHPTQKPVAIIIWLIQKYDKDGRSTIDPYLGSGTTAIACERLKRKWIGIEIEEKYCEIAAKRIEQERKQLKLF